jgi:cyclopropane-fatty-acyl-phospholipid synthase
MDGLLRYFLESFIRRGAMTFTAANGEQFSCGDGTGPHVFARFLTADAEQRVLRNPELALGEIYTEGNFIVENGSIADALAILMDQPEVLPRWAKMRWWLRYLGRHARQFNLRSRAKNNVARHYDLDGRLYSLFLDADKQYSCAYFEHPDTTLDDAQLAKKRHIAAKLLVRPDDRVLDIGSGWGGLGIYLAETSNCRFRMPARPRRTSASPSNSCSKTIATFPDRSSVSCPSACSSMSASIFTTPISSAAPNS